MSTDKKPIYKKWWFIAGAAIIIIAGISAGGGGGTDSSNKSDVTEKDKTEKKSRFDDEKYKYGTWMTNEQGVNVSIKLLRSGSYIYEDDIQGSDLGRWDGTNKNIIFYHKQTRTPIAEGRIGSSGELIFDNDRGTLYFDKR